MSKQKLILLFSIFISQFLLAQDLGNIELNNRLSILNDRAYFHFPADAKNIARPTDIMSADPNVNKETRIIFDRDKQRLVFFARELFVTSDNHLPASVSKGKGGEMSLKILSDRDSVLSVLSTPKKFDSTANAILINNLYVKTQDQSVFLVSAYINPEGFKDLKEYQALSEKVFTSLSKGSRRISFGSRTELLPIFDGGKKFAIKLPAGYSVTKDKKYDFEVLNFRKMKNINDTNWVSLTIYAGHHPSFFYGDYGFDVAAAEKPVSKFLGEKIQWLSFKSAEKQFLLKEQHIPANKIEEGLILHVAMLSNNKEGIEELTKIVEGISVTK